MSAIDDRSLSDALRRRAARSPDAPAYTFVSGAAPGHQTITWSQLDQRATTLGAHLRRQGGAGEPVLLALHSGLEFVESAFACWRAGAIAVPVCLPRYAHLQHRLSGIITHSRARLAIGEAKTEQQITHDAGSGSPAPPLTWIDPRVTLEPVPEGSNAAGDERQLAVLQYTSGSTGEPRGVMLSHRNLLHNSRLIAKACAHSEGEVIAGWLPLYHDMGLIGLVVQAVVAGVHCVLMSPDRFLMRPWTWLQMISDFRACSSPAPNFAYDLCVDRVDAERRKNLDLSCWRNALNGSEPVRAATLERFAEAFSSCGFQRTAFFPCYGLAEATLLVSAPDGPRQLRRRGVDGDLKGHDAPGGHVGCGKPAAETELLVVDPMTRRVLPNGSIGEAWVRSESVSSGYWNDPQGTALTFATLPAPDGRGEGASGPWLRTGDLGFLDDSGELFITGRLRELIIIAGRNHFPVDIERSVESADPSIAASGVVAFSAEVGGLERLIVAAEVRRPGKGAPEERTAVDVEAVLQRVRAALKTEHEVVPFEVVLLRPGAVPRTSSGKVKRLATREAYLARSLDVFDQRRDANACS